jgi:site-specific recombinase XerD
MASVIPMPNGHHWIQLRVGTSRHTIRLGRCKRRDAEAIKVKVEALAVAFELGIEPDPETLTWLGRCGDVLHRRITATGLTTNRARADVTIGELVTAFLRDYQAGSVVTKNKIRTSFGHITAFFGDDFPVRKVTTHEAERWRDQVSETYAEATISTTVKKARQLWDSAIEAGIARDNPWKTIRAGDQTNPERKAYVSRKVIDALLAAAPCDQWRLIIALSRYAGLRFPSEHFRLRRSDINWGTNRFIVRGKNSRVREVPIFAQLRPYLLAVTAEPAPPTRQLITGDFRTVSPQALRKQFLAQIKAAGFKVWPRIFHNLRSSCETDLAREGYAPHVYSGWLGNSPDVAQKHYLQTIEEDFTKAAGDVGASEKRA